MDVIGGYRIVRTLGRGSRADVFLGHAGNDPATARTAAIKVYRPATSTTSIDIEIEALARAGHRHLLRLDDLSTATDGRPALVLGRLGPATLSTLLLDRGELAVGEAVTVLAPVCLAVAELHRVGVAHRRLRSGCVVFDASGAPVITGFGHAELVGRMPELQSDASLTPAELSVARGVIADLADLTALVKTVLELTPPAVSTSTLLDWAARSGTVDAAELANRLFDLAPALPIDFSIGRPPAPSRGEAKPLGGTVEPSTPMWLSSLPLPDWPVLERAGVVLDGAVKSLRAVRRPVWIAAAGSAVLLVAALALVPLGESTSAAAPERGAAAASAPATEGSVSPDAVGEPDSLAAEKDGAVTDNVARDAANAAAEDAADAVTADDPVAAARTLLSLRSACFVERSVLCLDDVDQQASAAIEADGYRIRELQEGAQVEEGLLSGESGIADDMVITLVERLGNSALLALAQADPVPDAAPASVLLVKGEAGWRIRDVIVG